MLKYLVEAEEDISMDVQVGPKEEIKVSPVDKAKCDPESITVCKAQNEFYVALKDVEKYARLTESYMLEALNDIIDVNEDAGIDADNIVVIVDESTMKYAPKLEAEGVKCMRIISEADGVEDISMDVQVGPNEEEIRIAEDPQTANPVDAVKRDYGTVVVAKNDKEFFMDVEDVQKCAEVNCESVIDTLNNIIGYYEEHTEMLEEEGMIDADNMVVIVKEDTDEDLINELNEAGVNMVKLVD